MAFSASVDRASIELLKVYRRDGTLVLRLEND